MTMKLMELYAELGIKDTGFASGMDKARREGAQFGAQFQNATQPAQRGLEVVRHRAGQVANSMRVASTVAGAGLLYMGKQASDLSETMSFTNVTFEDSTDVITAWGDSALASLGLARETALDAANGFGGLFKTVVGNTEEAARLSKQMVQLGVDMSSAKNVELPEAMDALKSALIGEAEPIRRFNVLLSEATIQEYALRTGITKNVAAMTEQEKVQARLGVIMEQTKDIQGDYARTADSAANSQRRAAEAAKDASATLGESLAPIMAKAAQAGEAVANVFEAMPDQVQTGVVALGGLVFVAGPAAKGIQGVAAAAAWMTRSSVAAVPAMGAMTASMVAAEVAATGLAAAQTRGAVLIDATATSAVAATAKVGILARALGALKTLGVITVGIEVIRQASEHLKDGITLSDYDKKPELFGVTLPKSPMAPSNLPTSGITGSVTGMTDSAKEAAHALFEIEEGTEAAVDGLEDVAVASSTAGKDMAGFAGMTFKEFRVWRTGTVASLDGVEGKLDDLAGHAELTTDRILKTFSNQIEAQLDYEKNWAKVVARSGGDADGLLRKLQEMGLDGASVVSALASANENEFDKIINQWQRSQTVADRTSRVISGSLSTIGSTARSASGGVDALYDSLNALTQLGVPAVLQTQIRSSTPGQTPSVPGGGTTTGGGGGGGGGGKPPVGPNIPARAGVNVDAPITVHGNVVTQERFEYRVSEGIRGRVEMGMDKR